MFWRRKTTEEKAEKAAAKATRRAAYRAFDEERATLRDGTHPDAFVTVRMPRTGGTPDWQSAIQQARKHGMYDLTVWVTRARSTPSEEIAVRAHYEAPSTLRCEPDGPIEAGDHVRFSHGEREQKGIVTSVTSIPGGKTLHSFPYLDGCRDQCTGTLNSRPHVRLSWTAKSPNQQQAVPDVGETPRVLVLSANADSDLDLEEEVRSITQAIGSTGANAGNVVHAPAARPADFVNIVRSHSPRIVHFSGHGDSAGIELRNGSNQPVAASKSALSAFLQNRGVDLVVLQSCYSEEVADSLLPSVQSVVGTTDELSDPDANQFSGVFYHQLFTGASVGDAFRDGRDAVALGGGDDVFRLVGDTDLRLVVRS